MNPNQPDFSFISQANGPKRSIFSGAQTKKQRLMIVGFIAIVMIILIIVGSILINAFSTNNKEKLTSLATYQTEISRIMALGADNSTSGNVKGLAQTASLAVSTQAQKTVKIASDKGIKITSKELLTGITTDSDKLLEAAKNNNTYDETFKEIYTKKLTDYQTKLKSMINDEDDKKIKSALVEYYNSLALLAVDYQPKTN